MLRLCTSTTTPIVLRDGTRIPPGSRCTVYNGTRLDPEIYHPHPEKFDGRRFFLLLCCPSSSSKNGSNRLLTSTSTSHLGFGLGEHACPGRFFAAVEVKILLARLLMGYDVRLSNNAATAAAAAAAAGGMKFYGDGDGDQRDQGKRGGPEVKVLGFNMSADAGAEVLFRRRGGRGSLGS